MSRVQCSTRSVNKPVTLQRMAGRPAFIAVPVGRTMKCMPNRYAGTDEERVALDAYVKLWRAAHAVEVAANRHLTEHNLTVSQFAVLEALYHLGPLSQRQLADKILRSSGNLT